MKSIIKMFKGLLGGGSFSSPIREGEMGNLFCTAVKRSAMVLLVAMSVFGGTASAALLVTDNFGPSVLMYNQTTGAFEGTLVSPGSGGLITAHGIEIGPDGNIYVARSSSAINRYSPSGAFLGAFTSGANTIALNMIFGPDGNLYAGDYSSSAAIKRFNGATGAYIDTFVAAGSGGLNFPNGMTFGPDGNFYVSSGNSNTVKRYNGTTGVYMGNFAAGPTDPRGLVFGPDGNLYVSFDGVRRYDGTTGAFIDLFASGGGLNRPYGLAFGPDGNLYVANDGPHPGQILRYNGTTGAFIDVFASGGGLSSPKYFVFTQAATPPPTAVAGVNQTINVGQVVFLNGGNSFAPNTAPASLLYSWSFVSVPNGSTASLSNAGSATPSFVADAPGTYIVQLIVTDPATGLQSAPSQLSVSSLYVAPTADAGPAHSGIVGTTIALTGSGTAPSGLPLSFAWSIVSKPGGSTATLTNPNTANVSITPDVAGAYSIGLVVSDSFGSSPQSTTTVSVITAADYAQQQTSQAVNNVAAIPASQLDAPGHRNVLTNFIQQAIAAMQSGDNAQAKAKLNAAIARTDGYPLRGAVDGSGPGMDWITDANAQVAVYQALISALSVLP